MIDTVSDFGTLCRLTTALATRDPHVEVDWKQVDWETLRTLADEHRLSGYLFLELQAHPWRRNVPAAVMSHWKEFYLRQWTKNERLMVETSRLAGHFDREGVEVLFLKGPLLALRIYERLDARAISDIDLLLRRPTDVSRAEACLTALGYARASRLLINHAITQRFTYQLEYWKDDVPVELHWSLQRHVSLHLDPERIWNDRETTTVEKRSYLVPSREDVLLAYALSVPADVQVGKLTARTLLEIYLILRQMPVDYDWKTWLARRAEDGTRRIGVAVVSSALGLFASQDEMATLSRIVEPLLRESDRSAILAALARPASLSPWQRRLSAFSLYESSLPTSFAWWAASLPARVLAHPTESRRHLPWT